MHNTFTYFKRYCQFLLQYHVEALVKDTIERAGQTDLSVYKLLANYSDEEVFVIFRSGVEEQVLIPVIQDNPYEKIRQKIDAWKANTTIIPKDRLDIEDITSIHNIRRDAFLAFISYYDCKKEELFPLIKEINIFFNTCIDFGLKAYEEIQREALTEKSEMLSGILSNIPLIITRLNKEGKILFSAGSGLRSLGLNDHDLSGSNIQDDYINADNTKEALQGKPISFTGTTTSVSGEVREFENFYIPQKDGAIGFSIDITRQREAEDRFINLVEGVKDYAIFMLNPDGTVASWNEGARLFKGYTREEIIGKHFSIFYPQDKKDSHFPEYELEQAKKTGRFEDEGIRIRKDGSTFWANVIITPIYNRSKKLIGFTKITRDLTERKQAEEKLRQSEERFRNLIEGVKDYAIFMLNPDGTVASWNEGARVFKGYTRDEIIGKHFSIFYPQDKRDARFPEYELEQAKKLGRFEDEGIRVRKDGSTFWANVVLTAIYNDAKELIGFTKITRDLTEKKQAEEVLRRSEERYRLLIEAVEDYAIFVVSPEGKIASWNEGAKRLNGYTEQEVIGKSISIFYTQDKIDQKRPQYELEQVRKTGRFEYEGWRVRKDGTTFYANVIITALYDSDKNLIGFSKIIRDLTERKKYEENLHRINLELEEKVKIRTKELKDRTEELEKTVKELKRINNDLDSFIYTASHDLKAPISNLEGLIYALYEEFGEQLESNSNLSTFKGLIDASIKRFQTTIKELTEIAKIQKESSEDSEEVDLTTLIEDVKINITDQILKSNAKIITELDGCSSIKFVRRNLNSIFYNLISNGIKYRSQDRPPVIKIRCYVDEEYYMITCEDNGLGIKAENIGKMFTMFRRFHDHVEGTGVGLYIVKRIIENTGGRIEVESKEGEGSVFKIYLPKKLSQ